MRAANTNPATAELVSCHTTLERIREDFAFLDHWEDRYRYIIELGDALPHMQDDLKTPENLVHGCMSNAWILARAKDGRLALELESEARIVRGLIAILLCAVQGSRLEDAARHDFESLFSKLESGGTPQSIAGQWLEITCGTRKVGSDEADLGPNPPLTRNIL